MSRVYKVSRGAHATTIAPVIKQAIRTGEGITLRAIGAGAINQAVKAIALARADLAIDNLDVICQPDFLTLRIAGEERSGIELHLNRPGGTFPPLRRPAQPK